MRARVAAQFATLMCFMAYLGLEQVDMRLAPFYRDAQIVKAATSTAAEDQQQRGDDTDKSVEK